MTGPEQELGELDFDGWGGPVELPPPPPRTATSAEVARVLGVRISTVDRAADRGRIPCDKTAGGHRRFNVEEAVAAFRFPVRPRWTP